MGSKPDSDKSITLEAKHLLRLKVEAVDAGRHKVTAIRLLSDFTCLVSESTIDKIRPKGLFRAAGRSNERSSGDTSFSRESRTGDASFDAQVSIDIGLPKSLSRYSKRKTFCAPARILVCRCYGGQMWSITGRVDGRATEQQLNTWLADTQKRLLTDELNEFYEELLKILPRVDLTADLTVVGKSYRPGADADESQPVSIKLITDVLRERIFFVDREPKMGRTNEAPQTSRTPPADRLQGAVLIAGRTKSCKSLITRGLIHQLLTDSASYSALQNATNRRPHFVTCEDPIEVLFEDGDTSKEDVRDKAIDYTPRDKTMGDYSDLNSCFRDALRQTPACFLVGEARTDEDIKATLEFAATGHLVFATMHAGSLIDVFSKIFKATKAATPAARGLAAQALLAVIHLQPISINHSTHGKLSMVMPALWRRSPASTASLVSAGVGAIMPNFPGSTQQEAKSTNAAHDCLGRQYFTKLLFDEVQKTNMTFAAKAALIKETVAHARKLDLSGT